jgi:hypothetical protein
MQHDRTLFSRLSAAFEHGVIQLLSQQEVEGVSAAILQMFQESYGSTAFRCRYTNCTRASTGFASQQLRTQHETTHFQRVYCKVSTCSYSRVGFVNKSALHTHTKKYHAESTSMPVPPRLRHQHDTANFIPDEALPQPQPAQGSQQQSQQQSPQQLLLRADDILKLQCLPEDEKQKYRLIMMNFWNMFTNNPPGTPEYTSACQKIEEWSSKFIYRERQYRAKQKQLQQQGRQGL